MEKSEVIKKIVAFTNSLKIRGEINEMENNRLSDILNSKDNSKAFLPINNANVTI